MKKKNIKTNSFIYKNIFFIFSSIILITPLLFFEVNDYEEYSQGIFSVQFIYSSISNFFSNFNTSIGMGSTFPIGQGLFLYPTSLFAFNLQLFKVLTIILNSLIQYNFFKKICKKILKIKNTNLLNIFVILLVISLPNILFNYLTDWISHYTAFTLLFPVIYYLLKYQKYKQPRSIIKLTLFLALFVHNAHLGYSLQILIIFICLLILNNTNIFFHKYTFIALLSLFLFISFGKFYELISFFRNYPIVEPNLGNFTSLNIIELLKIILLPFNYILRIFDYIFKTNLSFENFVGLLNLRNPGYGIQIMLGFILSIYFIKKKISKEIYHFDYIFLILIIIYILNNTYNIINYLTYTKETINLFSLFLIIYFINFHKNKKIVNSILAILLFTNLTLYTESVYHLKNNDVLNKDIHYTKKTLLKDKLNSLKNDNSQFSRIYLSEKVFSEISNRRNIYFKKNRIFVPKDFNKFGLNVLNVVTKNANYIALRDGHMKLNNNIFPKNEEIKNTLIMNFFKIKYVIIYKSEFILNNYLDFRIIYEIDVGKDKLLIVENINYGNDLVLKNDNFYNVCNQYNKLNCLLNIKENLDTNNKVIIDNKIKNKIQIANNNSKKIKLILPFILNDVWKLNKTNKKLFNYFDIIELEPFEKLEINLINSTYVLYKFITIVLFLFLLFLSLNKKFI